MKGQVKKVFQDKGFGFVTAAGGEDYFFHATAVENSEFDAIQVGSQVEFELGQGPKGPRAEKVRLVA